MSQNSRQVNPSPLDISYWKGGIAAATVFAVGFGLKALNIPDFWVLLASLALVAAWVVGYSAAIVALVNKPYEQAGDH